MTTIDDFHFESVVQETPSMVQGWAEAFCEGTYAYSTIQPTGWTISACQDGGAPSDIQALCTYCGFCLVTLTATDPSYYLTVSGYPTDSGVPVASPPVTTVSPPAQTGTVVTTTSSSTSVANDAGGYDQYGCCTGCGDVWCGTTSSCINVLPQNGETPEVCPVSTTLSSTSILTESTITSSGATPATTYIPPSVSNTANTVTTGVDITDYAIVGGILLVAAAAYVMTRKKNQT